MSKLSENLTVCAECRWCEIESGWLGCWEHLCRYPVLPPTRDVVTGLVQSHWRNCVEINKGYCPNYEKKKNLFVRMLRWFCGE